MSGGLNGTASWTYDISPKTSDMISMVLYVYIIHIIRVYVTPSFTLVNYVNRDVRVV